MLNLLTKLEVADFEFLAEIMRSRVAFTSDKQLKAAISHFAGEIQSNEKRQALCILIEREIRYLGSSDAAYLVRKVWRPRGGSGVSFREVVTDVFRKLKLKPPNAICTDEELVEHLVQAYTTARVRQLPFDQQKLLLETVGMSTGDIGSYLKGNSARFALPAVIQLAGLPAAQRIVTNVVVGTVGNYIGMTAAKSLIGNLVTRFPIWGQSLGPIAWALTGLWTAYDLQGPAMRKTVPISLFLGLCMLRDGGFSTDAAQLGTARDAPQAG
jgi:uncharacterized protein YaaW (UPF0174 family)